MNKKEELGLIRKYLSLTKTKIFQNIFRFNVAKVNRHTYAFIEC